MGSLNECIREWIVGAMMLVFPKKVYIFLTRETALILDNECGSDV